MTVTVETDCKDPLADAGGDREFYRHPLPTRLFHWMNAAAFLILIMSGLQIFNAHPRLYWGNVGYRDVPAIFEISGARAPDGDRGWIAFGSYRVDGGGILGVMRQTPYGPAPRRLAFPPAMTLPSTPMDLAAGRGWHFLALYLFAFNLLFYMIWGFVSGRFRHTLWPTREQMTWTAIKRDLWMHIRLRHATGPEAAHYNLLQKLSYIGVLFILMPLMIATGMTMSPSALARFPWLLDLFDGRQSARTIHFICAWSLVGFLAIHIFQIFVAGVVNEMRSMITGWFRIGRDR